MAILTRADRWVIGVLLAVALGGIGLNMAVLTGDGERRADVYKDGLLVQSVRLRPGYHQELRLGGAVHYNLVVADNGRVMVAEADCPDQVCVRTGWVSLAPQQIVCLPYRVIIKVVSAQPDVDEIAR